jgi:vacuolar protein sorting-associated protein 13A/C
MTSRTSPSNPVSWALNSMTMALVNINEAPLNFRSLLVENGRMALPALQERIMLHYKDQVAGQVYRIVGSADFLGNPVGLFNNLGSAVGDIFYEPYLGVVMHGNKDIGLGIARVSFRDL